MPKRVRIWWKKSIKLFHSRSFSQVISNLGFSAAITSRRTLPSLILTSSNPYSLVQMAWIRTNVSTASVIFRTQVKSVIKSTSRRDSHSITIWYSLLQIELVRNEMMSMTRSSYSRKISSRNTNLVQLPWGQRTRMWISIRWHLAVTIRRITRACTRVCMTITRLGWVIKSTHLTIKSIVRVKAVKEISVTNKEAISIIQDQSTVASVHLRMIHSHGKLPTRTLIKLIVTIQSIISNPSRVPFRRTASLNTQTE